MRALSLLVVLLLGCTNERLIYVSQQSTTAPCSNPCGDKQPGESCAHEGDSCSRACAELAVEVLTCTRVSEARCTGGAAGVASPAGGCCSEWIPCASGLSCAPQGAVYPGSQGICVKE